MPQDMYGASASALAASSEQTTRTGATPRARTTTHVKSEPNRARYPPPASSVMRPPCSRRNATAASADDAPTENAHSARGSTPEAGSRIEAQSIGAERPAARSIPGEDDSSSASEH